MTTPRILIIAGSDSGGGAGLQADIKTVTMLGGHAMTAVTAVTAQNTLGVQRVLPVPADMVLAQIRSCVEDIGVDAIKIGMLGSAETARAVAEYLSARHPRESGDPSPARSTGSDSKRRAPASAGVTATGIPIVFDPVMIATSGAPLADAATIAAFARLLDVATIATPNLPELAALGGRAAVLAHGCHLAEKGGHGEGDAVIDRLLAPAGTVVAEERHPRIATTSTHGTGCTFASALACGLAEGLPLAAAFARAVAFVRASLERAPGLGHGHGPMGQQFATEFRCPA